MQEIYRYGKIWEEGGKVPGIGLVPVSSQSALGELLFLSTSSGEIRMAHVTSQLFSINRINLVIAAVIYGAIAGVRGIEVTVMVEDKVA